MSRYSRPQGQGPLYGSGRNAMKNTAREKGPAADTRREQAWRAVNRMNEMLPQLTKMAQTITGDSELRCELISGTPCTDGKTIYLRPPMELGQYIEHNRLVCGVRDENALQQCSACATMDNLFAVIFHEMSHVIFGTFEDVSDRDKFEAIEHAVREYPSTDRDKLLSRINALSPGSGYMQLANTASPFMPTLVNALEDVRVNRNMFRARSGTRKMFDALAIQVFMEGSQQLSGEAIRWDEQPENAQIMVGVFCIGSEYDYDGWFSDEVEQALGDPELIKLVRSLDNARSVKAVYRQAWPILLRLRELGYCLSKQEVEEASEQLQAESRESQSDPDQDPPEGEEGESSPERESDSSADQSDDDASDSGGDSPDQSDSEEPDKAEGEDAGDGGTGQPEPDEDEETTAGGGQDAGEESESDPNWGDQKTGDTTDGGPEEVDDEIDSDSIEGESGDASSSAGQSTDDDDDDESDDESGAGASGDDEAPDAADNDREDGSGPEDGSPGESGTPDDDEDDQPASGEADDEQTGDGGQPSSGEFDSEANPWDNNVPDAPEYKGDPEDVLRALQEFGGHDEEDPFDNDKLVEEAEINRAVEQFAHFDEPSSTVAGVYETAPEDQYGAMRNFPTGQWGIDAIDQALADFMPEEKLINRTLQKLRVVFADNKRAKRQTGHRSGRIVSNQLASVMTGNDKVFSRAQRPGKRDYFVAITLDVSGSTSGGGRLMIIKSLGLALGELFDRLGVDFVMYAHSGEAERQDCQVNMFRVKGLREPWTQKCRRAVGSLQSDRYNLDGHTFEFMRKLCDKSSATDKIILYVTDGHMPEKNHDDELKVLTRELKTIAKRGYEILGVGVHTDSPKRHGLKTVQLDSVNDLPRLVAAIENELIQKGVGAM